MNSEDTDRLVEYAERITVALEDVAAANSKSGPNSLLTADERNDLNEQLEYAVCNNNVEDVSNLIKAGANIYHRSKNPSCKGATLFALACKQFSGNIEIVRQLRMNGAVMSDGRPFADSCLQIAEEKMACTSDDRLVQYLVTTCYLKKRKRTN